jgi:hypothetical protein
MPRTMKSVLCSQESSFRLQMTSMSVFELGIVRAHTRLLRQLPPQSSSRRNSSVYQAPSPNAPNRRQKTNNRPFRDARQVAPTPESLQSARFTRPPTTVAREKDQPRAGPLPEFTLDFSQSPFVHTAARPSQALTCSAPSHDHLRTTQSRVGRKWPA